MIGDEPFNIHVDVSDFGPIDPGEIVAPYDPNLFVGPVEIPKQNWFILLIIALIVYFSYGEWK